MKPVHNKLALLYITSNLGGELLKKLIIVLMMLPAVLWAQPPTGAEFLDMPKAEQMAFIEGYVAGVATTSSVVIDSLSGFLNWFYAGATSQMEFMASAEQITDMVADVVQRFDYLRSSYITDILLSLPELLAAPNPGGGAQNDPDSSRDPANIESKPGMR